MSKTPTAPCPWCKKEPVLGYLPGYNRPYWYYCQNDKCPVQPATCCCKTKGGAKRAWNKCRRNHEETT